MIEKKIKFVTPEQIMSFCAACQKMKSDIDVVNISNRHVRIDGMLLLVNGEDEGLVEEKFSSFLAE